MKLNREQLDRLNDLLADRVTGDLEPQDEGQYQSLLRRAPEAADEIGFESAAAAIDEAFAGATTGATLALPAELRTRLIASGRSAVSGMSGTGAVQGIRHTDVADFQAAAERRSLEVPVKPGGAGSIVPWLVAAAASLLAIVGWWQAGDTGSPALPPEPSVRTAAELRLELLQSAEDLVQLTWTATEDETAAGAGGDVVWSARENTGYMRISGLQANDPSEFQYQLWIFDQERDDRYPVDGGVFDIPADAVGTEGGIIVPIDATLPVDRPVLFAITVEIPGGVVVSSRDRIVLLAQET